MFILWSKHHIGVIFVSKATISFVQTRFDKIDRNKKGPSVFIYYVGTGKIMYPKSDVVLSKFGVVF